MPGSGGVHLVQAVCLDDHVTCLNAATPMISAQRTVLKTFRACRGQGWGTASLYNWHHSLHNFLHGTFPAHRHAQHAGLNLQLSATVSHYLNTNLRSLRRRIPGYFQVARLLPGARLASLGRRIPGNLEVAWDPPSQGPHVSRVGLG